jgi:hypothetical protein
MKLTPRQRFVLQVLVTHEPRGLSSERRLRENELFSWHDGERLWAGVSWYDHRLFWVRPATFNALRRAGMIEHARTEHSDTLGDVEVFVLSERGRQVAQETQP